MTAPRSEQLPAGPDAAHWFERLLDLPGAVFLDSGSSDAQGPGRRDVLAASPTAVHTLPPRPQRRSVEGFLARLAATDTHREPEEGGFRGTGLIGYVGYDAGVPLHGLEAPDPHSRLPSAWVGDYPWAVVCDRDTGRCTLQWRVGVSAEHLAELRARLLGPAPARPAFSLTRGFESNLDHAAYRHAVRRIHAYIHAGDCYQVNLARRFEAACEGDGWSAYRALRDVARAPFSAYLRPGPELELMCLSPERFLRLDGRRVSTSPIKGTRPRGSCEGSDAELARQLLASGKDRAENVMIVDLLRNDLGRNCEYGSVACERLFELESYATVHHMVSTVSGRLRTDRSWVDLFRDAFPGGSITGAPKRRAMQIIAELEPHARQAYCGSVFHATDSGHVDSNIAIRSLVRDRSSLRCWAGGGIVADSTWENEFEETEHKVGAFLGRLRDGCGGQ